jgi:hypothetical protein
VSAHTKRTENRIFENERKDIPLLPPFEPHATATTIRTTGRMRTYFRCRHAYIPNLDFRAGQLEEKAQSARLGLLPVNLTALMSQELGIIIVWNSQRGFYGLRSVLGYLKRLLPAYGVDYTWALGRLPRSTWGKPASGFRC